MEIKKRGRPVINNQLDTGDALCVLNGIQTTLTQLVIQARKNWGISDRKYVKLETLKSKVNTLMEDIAYDFEEQDMQMIIQDRHNKGLTTEDICKKWGFNPNVLDTLKGE